MGKDETRRRILAAAAAEFVEKGYGGATTRGIADRAGVNEVTLFRHFGSKQELLKGVVAEAPDTSSLEDTLSTGLARLPPYDALLRLGREWATVMQPRAAWLGLQLAGGAGLAPLPRGRSIGLRKRLADYIQAEQQRGTFRRTVDSYLAAEAFFVGIAGFVIGHEILFAEGSAPSVDTYLRTYVELFLHGLEDR